MRFIPSVVAAFVGLFAAQSGPSIDGEWKVIEIATPKGTLKLKALSFVLTLNGDKYTLKTSEVEQAGKVTFDSTKTPWRIDLEGGKERGAMYMIAKRDGDKLTVCWWTKAEDRQETFDLSKQNPPGNVWVLQKVGP